MWKQNKHWSDSRNSKFSCSYQKVHQSCAQYCFCQKRSVICWPHKALMIHQSFFRETPLQQMLNFTVKNLFSSIQNFISPDWKFYSRTHSHFCLTVIEQPQKRLVCRRQKYDISFKAAVFQTSLQRISIFSSKTSYNNSVLAPGPFLRTV